MKFTHLTAILTLSLFSTVGCAGGTEGPEPELQKDPVIEKKENKELVAQIQKILKEEPSDLKRFKFNSVDSKISSAGKRVLILDSKDVPKAALLRHSDKNLGVYHWNDLAQKFEKRTFWFDAPISLMKVNELLQSQSTPVRTYEFKSVADELKELSSKVKTFDPKGPYVSHASRSYEWLAEYSPDSQFLTMEFPEPTAQEFCKINDYSTKFKLRRQYDRAFYQILDLIEKKQIDYINLSYVSDFTRTKKQIDTACKGTWLITDQDILEYLEIRSNFVHRLQEESTALMIQAAPNEMDRSVTPGERGYEMFCPVSSKSIVVSHYNILGSSISADGESIQRSLLPGYQKNLFDCANMVINSGIDQIKAMRATPAPGGGVEIPSNPKDYWWNQDSLFYSISGYKMYPVETMANSWATPIATAFVINERERLEKKSGRRLSNEALLRKFHKLAFDPLKNHQLNQN